MRGPVVHRLERYPYKIDADGSTPSRPTLRMNLEFAEGGCVFGAVLNEAQIPFGG